MSGPTGGATPGTPPAGPREPHHGSADILDLRHELLRVTDRAVGAEAELDHLRRRVAQLKVELERATARAGQLSKERDRLRTRIDAIHASTTWRVGRLLVRPAARMSRRRRAR